MFDAPYTGIKRPPPPRTKVQVTGAGERGALPPMAAKQLSSKIPKPWQRPLVLLATILLTSGLTAALTALLLRGDEKQQVAAAKGIAPQAEPKAAAKATEPTVQHLPAEVDKATRRQGGKALGQQSDMATGRQGDKANGRKGNVESSATEHDGAPKQDSAETRDGTAKDDAVELEGAVSPPKANAPPKKQGDDDPLEPLDLAGEARKTPTPMPEPLTGLVDEPKPELLGANDAPTLPVVADTPEALYAARTKPKTAEFLAARGGTLEAQKAVEDGLNWLARHQGLDGHWGSDCLGPGPSSRCNQNAPCRGQTGEAFDVAHTGLALLAFQAGGHYYFNHQKYSGQVNRGIVYLLEKQLPDGSFVDLQAPNSTPGQYPIRKAGSHEAFMYEHAIATFALCEACAVALAEGRKPTPGLQLAAQRAVSYIENIQHDDGGWRYLVDHNEPSDCSVSGWVMLALKTAREAKLNVSPKTISRMMEFFADHYADGRTIYRIPPEKPSTDSMTAVGMLAVEFIEHKLDSPVVQAGATYLADQADALFLDQGAPAGAALGALSQFPNINPDRFKNGLQRQLIEGNWGLYLCYNCTLAMFQVGGEPWKRWNDGVRDHLIHWQSPDPRPDKNGLRVVGGPPAVSCERGSWSPDTDPYSDWGGRIYTTALAVLTLEVYYRYQRVAGQPEKEKFFEK
ncbi:MAG TPA: prenyltransferase/squalene oxidase repeat-containing protein [Pirellulales bacterium]|nr:prenyltransferase/squalene oxidase repeat-containing protein [Pirellulales bacterium]